MRISLFFPNYTEKPYGSRRVFFEFANRLSQRGHRVTLISLGRSRRAQLRVMRSDVLRQVGLYPFVSWFDVSPSVRLRFVLNRGEATRWRLPRTDVLVLDDWRSERHVEHLRTRTEKVVQVAWGYDAWVRGDPELQAAVEHGLSNAGLPVIAGSRFVASMLNRFGREPVAIICPGVDTDVFRSLIDVNDRSSTIGMIVQPDRPSKGTFDGIAALERLRERGHVFTARAVCRSRPGDLPAWITTTAAADDEAMADFYNQCSIFLVPSRGEGFGLPALEAMACGAAVVSTDNGGVSDYARPGDNILLAPVGDVEAMADQLEVLLKDDDLRRRLARQGLATASEFSWDRSTEALEGVLASL